METLTLKLKTSGVNSLGLDITWANSDFLFKDYNDLGVFDIIHASLFDDIQGHLLISASNTDNREIFGEHDIIEIRFVWKDLAFPTKVEFETKNETSKNSQDIDVPLKILPQSFNPIFYATIEFIWS